MKVLSITCIGSEQIALVKKVVARYGGHLQDVRQIPTHSTQLCFGLPPETDIDRLEFDLDNEAGRPRGRVSG